VAVRPHLEKGGAAHQGQTAVHQPQRLAGRTFQEIQADARQSGGIVRITGQRVGVNRRVVLRRPAIGQANDERTDAEILTAAKETRGLVRLTVRARPAAEIDNTTARPPLLSGKHGDC
jgi:hypothetical protein